MGGQILKFANRLNASAGLLLALIATLASTANAQLPPNVYTNSKQYNFAYQLGSSAAVQSQTLQVISDGDKTFTATAQLVNPTTVPNWLTVNGATTTTGTTNQASSFVSVGVLPTGLPVGVYTANIRVEIAGLPLATTDITVYLRVSGTPQVALNVPAVNIQGQSGSVVSVLLPVSSTSTAIPYAASVSQYYGASG